MIKNVVVDLENIEIEFHLDNDESETESSFRIRVVQVITLNHPRRLVKKEIVLAEKVIEQEEKGKQTEKVNFPLTSLKETYRH